MAPFVVRRSERIDYRVPVTLIAEREQAAPVLARSLDVSEGGMRVLSHAPVPVGALVRCELTLEGQTTVLEGRVAWLAQPGDGEAAAPRHDNDNDNANAQSPVAGETFALGMGIRFERLTGLESGALRQLITRATEGYMPAELELSGVRAPVAARAVPTPTGARISAPLPWLRRGAPVGVRFHGASDDVVGHIAEAALRELPSGGRRLQIEVEAEAPARERRHTRYGDAFEFERAPKLATASAGVTEAPSPLRVAPIPAHRRSAAMFALGLLVGAATTAAMLHLMRGETPIVRLSAQEARAALEAGTLGAHPMAQPHELPAPGLDPDHGAPSELDPTTSLDTQDPAHMPSQLAPDPASPSQTQEVAGSAHARSAIPLVAPDLRVEGSVVIVRIPFNGTLEQMNARVWADPYALALDLPKGSSTLDGRYPLADPTNLARQLRVQRRGGALLVRLTLSQPLASHSVARIDDVLELRTVPRGALPQR